MVTERKGEAVKPVVLLRLMEELGPTKVSKKLGVSTTTLYKARTNNLVSKSIELAAVALSSPAAPLAAQSAPLAAKSGASDPDKVLVIMEVPKSKVELLKRVALQFGAEVES